MAIYDDIWRKKGWEWDDGTENPGPVMETLEKEAIDNKWTN